MPGPRWFARVGPWVGIGTSPAALMAGGGVAEGQGGLDVVVAIVAGVLGLTALAVAQGALGQRRHAPLLALTAGPLGTRASRATASVAMLAMMLGWFAVNVSAAGAALGRLIGAPDRVGMVLVALVALALVWGGVGRLSWAALTAGAATVALAAYGLWVVTGERDVGLAGPPESPEPLLAGAALMVGYGAAFALRTPDFTRDLARTRHVVWCALAGLTVPVVAFALVGALLQRSTGTWDLADVLTDLGSTRVAYLFVAVGFAGSIMTNIWSGALSLGDALPRIPHRRAMVMVTAAGTLLAALRFSQWMIPYLTVMALTASPLIAVMLTHEVLRRRGAAVAGRAWHGPGLAAWGAGAAGGLALAAAGSPLALPIGLVVAALGYAAGARLAAGAHVQTGGG